MKLNEFLENEKYRASFLARIQNELAQTTLSNFALDVAGDLLIGEIVARDATIEALSQEKNDLIAKTTADRELIATLRERAEKAERDIHGKAPKAAHHDKPNGRPLVS
jgi:hypothetical protein